MVRTLAEIQAQWNQDTLDQGYRVIPSHPNYEVTMYGTVRSVVEQREIKAMRTSMGLRVSFWDSEERRATFHSLKRLVESAYPHRAFTDEVREKAKRKPVRRITETDQRHIPIIEGEVWRTIDDFATYEISDRGRIRFKSTGRFLKIVNDKVHLSKENKGYKRYHSILMAQSWPEVKEYERGHIR